MAGQPLLRGVSFKLERRDADDDRRAQRRGQDDAAADARRRGVDRPRRAEPREGRADHAARPAPSARARRGRCATTCSRAASRSSRSRPSWPSSSGAWREGATDEALLARYARAQAQLEARGGYLWRDRATAMARGLGFGEEDLDRGLDSFSGGQLTRASLARALATGADVLLLDEPTNHLDIESLEWLEQTLVALDAAIVLVAHDRWFLEAVGTAVLELEAGRSRFFSGTWHQLAPRAGRARDGAGQGDRQAAGGDRAHGALHRALPREGDEGPPGAVAREAARRRSSASSATRATARAWSSSSPRRSARAG